MIPSVIVYVNQVRIPFKTACAPSPGIVIATDPDAGTVAQSRVSVRLDVVDHVRVVDRNVNIFLLYGLDNNGLFFDNLNLFVTL